MKKITEMEKMIADMSLKIGRYEKEHSVQMLKAEYIGCQSCGSKLKKVLLSTEKCPLCHSDLRSKTTIETLNNYRRKLTEYKDKYERLIKKNDKTVVKKTLEQLADEFSENRFDYEIERHKCKDFIEIIGKIGGDVLVYRIYKNGDVFER